MEEIKYETRSLKLPADLYTPVGVFLKLRDTYQDTVLLESSDFHAADNSFSFLAFDPLAIFSIEDKEVLTRLWNRSGAIRRPAVAAEVYAAYADFSSAFREINSAQTIANGLFGYLSFNSVFTFEDFQVLPLRHEIPPLRFSFYRFVISFDHFRDELTIYENIPEGEESQLQAVLTRIRNRQAPVYAFSPLGSEKAHCSDERFLELVKTGIRHCHRGDVFQIVLSRRFSREFSGDEFNVYRALRSVNPSPYLFYFDYGNFKLFGSSPEAQLVVNSGKARINPIAGTFKRTGNDEHDRILAEKLKSDPKETAEHVMLVDLARNDLSKFASDVKVDKYQQVHYYSHVIHLVSEVRGNLPNGIDPLQLLAETFPAGTLSGAPKYKAIELIAGNEPHARGYYGGCAGWIGFNGDINTTITIRTFLSKQNTLHFQAGAGVVAASVPESELQEVNNKLGALRTAIEKAAELSL